MAISRAPTVAAYLAELPPDRRAVIAGVRDVIRRHLPAGYIEEMGWGMISWGIPLSRYPDTYNGRPLCHAGLAAQKSHNSLYLMGAYTAGQRRALARAFADAGLRLDMGKSCIRFRTLADLPLDAIGALVAALPPEKMIEAVERSRSTKGSHARKSRNAPKKAGKPRRGAKAGTPVKASRSRATTRRRRTAR